MVMPPVLFFIHRDQAHWDLPNDPAGYVSIVKNALLGPPEDEALKLLIQRLAINCTYISHAAGLGALLGLPDGQNKQQGVYSDHIIDGVMKTLISKMLTPGNSTTGHLKHVASLCGWYLDLFNENKNIHRRGGYLAKKMEITPRNLNTACRKAGVLITTHIPGKQNGYCHTQIIQ